MCTLPAAVGRARAEPRAPLVAAANLEGRRRAAGVRGAGLEGRQRATSVRGAGLEGQRAECAWCRGRPARSRCRWRPVRRCRR